MLALYRKYRPKTLSEVVGQESVTKSLESAISSGKISHAYLFTGPRGTGKTSVARIFAHEVNHFPYELEDSYLDIIEIDAASNTGVDNIRELREKATIAPSKGNYKVYIIDEVHMLSKSAFNALLKTLEEPPAHVIFIMATTDAHTVPITISSRSLVYTFNLAPPEIMEKHLRKISDLEKIKISDAALKVIVRRGGGSFRDSLSLLDQISSLGDGETEISETAVQGALGLPADDLIDALLLSYQANNLSEISELLKKILNSGVKSETLAEEIIKKILASPTPALLPLLEKLPAVSAPFPEAKLLLAFYNSPFSTFSAPKSTSLSVPQPAKTSLKTPENPAQNLPQTPAPTPVIEKHEARVQPPKTDLSLSAFHDSIKLANPVIHQQLLKSTLNLDGNVLNIYPSKKIIKTILTRKNNFAVLASNLPENVEIIVHSPDENPSEKSVLNDSALSKISDIMGAGIKEVNEDGGGIPF